MNNSDCPVCGTETKHAFTAQIMRKYDVSYHECSMCGFLHTEEPYWVDEAYKSAVSTADTGILGRNIQISRHLTAFLYLLDYGRGQYLDVAAGYGILVRLMRNIGFDFYWYDPYCENIFAPAFAEKKGAKYSVVSAFEVLEHIQSPVEFLSEIISEYGVDAICTTTTLRPKNSLPDKNWWYYSHETGQHISFYSEKTLRILAEKIGMTYIRFGILHVLIKKDTMPTFLRLMGWRLCRIAIYLWACKRLSSFAHKDRRRILET